MPRLTNCRKCGHKLASSNKTGECYRVCKLGQNVELKKEEPVPQGVVRKLMLTALCEQFAIDEAKLLSMATGKYKPYVRARYVAYYLLMHDFELNESNAAKVMGRMHSNVKSIVELVERDMDDYRHDINAVRAKLEQKLAEKKQTVAA